MSLNTLTFRGVAIEKEIFAFSLKLRTGLNVPINRAKVTSKFKGKTFETLTDDNGNTQVKAFPGEIAELNIEKKGFSFDKQFFEAVDLSSFVLRGDFFSVKLVDANFDVIENALIELQGLNGTVDGVTDENGFLFIEIPFRSEFLIKISKSGFKNLSQIQGFAPRDSSEFIHAVPLTILEFEE